MNNKITTKMNVKDNLINVMRIDNIDYNSFLHNVKFSK